MKTAMAKVGVRCKFIRAQGERMVTIVSVERNGRKVVVEFDDHTQMTFTYRNQDRQYRPIGEDFGHLVF